MEIGTEMGRDRFEQLRVQFGFPDHQQHKFLQKKDNPSFGEVFELIASKECRNRRDRYLAIASFLNLATYEELCQELQNKSADEACEWI